MYTKTTSTISTSPPWSNATTTPDEDSIFPDDGTVEAGDVLIARSQDLLRRTAAGSTRRRPTRSIRRTATVGDALAANTWYDAAGNVIKQQAAGRRRSPRRSTTVWAGPSKLRRLRRRRGPLLRRQRSSSVVDADGNVEYGDTIFEQTETSYDEAGNAI